MSTPELRNTVYVTDQKFVAPAFEETRAIRRLHNFPRFGYPKDVALIASEHEADRTEYFYG